jgi:hypothetical protein
MSDPGTFGMSIVKKINIQKNTWRRLFLVCFLLFFYCGAAAVENGVLTGVVLDVSGNPVVGVEVYVYDDTNIRRPADFISPPTGGNGEFRVVVPPGRYFVVARLRQGGRKYGPLLSGDKHSGPPLEIDVMPGEQVDEEFVVADLEETSRLTVKFDTSFIKVQGMLRSKEGEPLENVYAFANRQAAAKKIPDYVGAWTDRSGTFSLYLPEGTYYFGMARTFPPGVENVPTRKVVIDIDTKGNNIVIEE